MGSMRNTLAAVLLIASVGFGQTTPTVETYVTPGDNLVVEGVPKIPTSLADDLDRYTEMRGATLADWHPTRREMLISTRFADASQIHSVKFPGGARTQLTFYKDSVYDA